MARGGASATLISTTPSIGDPVFFSFLGVAGLPADLLTPQNANMRVSLGAGATTTAAASLVTVGSSTFLVQPFNDPFTLSFVRASDYVYRGHDYGTNLLTVTVGPAVNVPDLFTGNHASSATMQFDNTNYAVTFSSGFLDFPAGAAEDGALSFSAATPSFSKGTRFLNNFKVDSTGTFDSDPKPVGTILPVPEPTGLALLGVALLGLGVVRPRRA